MAVARQRHDRALVAAHAQLIGAMFTDAKIDWREFIKRGQLGLPAVGRLPYLPAVELKVQEIIANGGKLIVPVEAK